MASLYTITTYGCREYLRREGLITEGELILVEAQRIGVVTIDEIQTRVAEHFQIPKAEMTSARRDREVARPRQVAMYLSKQLTPRSMPEIGRRFGKRDHTTAIHAVRQIARLREKDPELNLHVRALVELLSKRRRAPEPSPAPPPEPATEHVQQPQQAVIQRAWCDQCSNLVCSADAARCASPWCKLKGAGAVRLRREAAR